MGLAHRYRKNKAVVVAAPLAGFQSFDRINRMGRMFNRKERKELKGCASWTSLRVSATLEDPPSFHPRGTRTETVPEPAGGGSATGEQPALRTTHFICIGFAGVNEICFSTELCGFIGVFEGFCFWRCEREWS